MITVITVTYIRYNATCGGPLKVSWASERPAWPGNLAHCCPSHTGTLLEMTFQRQMSCPSSLSKTTKCFSFIIHIPAMLNLFPSNNKVVTCKPNICWFCSTKWGQISTLSNQMLNRDSKLLKIFRHCMHHSAPCVILIIISHVIQRHMLWKNHHILYGMHYTPSHVWFAYN